MFLSLRQLARTLGRKGFAGPHYAGLLGKLRFLWESLVARHELVFVLSADSFDAAPTPSLPGFTLQRIHDFGELEAFRQALHREWYPGLIEGWRGPWSWGERLYIGLQDGAPVSFNWLQVGDVEGQPTYWGRVFANEYRILRGGVAPSQRGRGTNTMMKHLILRSLFDEGATRVWAECYERNVPSVRTLHALGFRVIGRLTVLELAGLRGFIRWQPAPAPSPSLERTPHRSPAPA